MPTEIIEVKMSRSNASPWGFRLHGGADFGTPLTIQKVRPPHPYVIPQLINAPKEVFYAIKSVLEQSNVRSRGVTYLLISRTN